MSKLPDKYHTLVLDKWHGPLRLINAVRCIKLFVNEEALAYDDKAQKCFTFEEWLRRFNYQQLINEGKSIHTNHSFSFFFLEKN